MQNINLQNTMKIKFSNPPLREVVFSVSFETLKFSSVHFGRYWELIKNEFPVLPEDKAPNSEEEEFFLLSLPPLRRVVFRSEDEQKSIQLQKNHFAFNFRYKQDSEYPHFQKLLTDFLKHWKCFCDWWQQESEEPIVPLQCKLTYLNIIDREFGWKGYEDNRNIFTLFEKEWENSFQYPEILNCETRFTLPDNLGYVDVDIQQGQVKTDELKKIDAILFSLTAISQDRPNDIVKWYNKTHDHILQIFSSLIREDIQEIWGKSYEQ